MSKITIDKAIKILSIHANAPTLYHGPDSKDAMQLGIEALKRIKINRDNYDPVNTLLLTGETIKKE